MTWMGRLLLGAIFVMMASMTVSAYALMDGEKRHETVLIKNSFVGDASLTSQVSMADEPGLCLMYESLDCFETVNVID